MLHLSFLITEVKHARGAHSYVQGKNQGTEKRTGAQDLQGFRGSVNVKPESLHILFQDIDKEDWGTRGALASDL